MLQLRPDIVKLCVCAILLCTFSVCFGQTLPPRIFYTDLLSGPSTGGQANEGAFVTLYGTGFGRTRGVSTVTIGGIPVFGYPVWSDKLVTVQIGIHARTGSLIVHVASRRESNGQPFTVRAGHIYFVSPLGSDLHDGSFSHPWKTLTMAVASLRAGDITYALDGVTQDALDKYDSALLIQSSGQVNAPLALVAYPGAKVTVGSFSGPQIAARTPNIDRTSDHWVIAGLIFHGAQEALDVTYSTDWRMIGNDFSCPHGFGPTGCIETEQSTHLVFLGNNVHDVAEPGTTKVYHAVYFSTDSNHIEVGWNTISAVRGCRGLQFHSSPDGPGTGLNQYDLHVHDNVIHDVVCDGINFATIDPSKGPVEAYNNLIYNVGTGPDPKDGSADYACIYVQGGANVGKPGSGTVELYNNTLFNCGARGNTDSGAISLSSGSPQQQVRLRNNLILLRSKEPLLSPNSTASPLIGVTNIVWSPSGPTSLNGLPGNESLRIDPLLNDPSHNDFAPKKGSPAIDAGSPVSLSWDLYGNERKAGVRPDIGAIQHIPSSVP